MNSKLIDLPKELSILKDTTSIQLENLKNEVTLFCNRVKKLNDQIKNADEFQSTILDEFMDVWVLVLTYFIWCFKKKTQVNFFYRGHITA